MSSSQTLPAPRNWNRRVLALAVPIIAANLAQPVLSLIDTWIAGHLPGPHFLGGIALAGVVFNFLFWGFGFLRMTTTGLTAQAFGAKDRLALRDHLYRGLLVALGGGALVLILQEPLIGVSTALLGGSPAVQGVASLYAHARIWSAPATLANLVILGVLLGQQRVGAALALQILVYALNLVVTLLLVYAFDLGVVGIGAGTAAGEWTGCLVGLAVVLRSARIPGQPFSSVFDRMAFGRLLSSNSDIFLRSFCLLLAFSFFARSGASQGDTILAANAVLLTFLSLLSYGLDGFAHASEALVGSAIGARDRTSLRAIIRSTFLCGFLVAIAISLAFALFGPSFVRLLTDQAEIRQAAIAYLPYIVLLPVIAVSGYLLDGIFIGATRTRELRDGMAVCLVFFVLAASGLQMLFANHGLWTALLAFMVARGLVLGSLLTRITGPQSENASSGDVGRGQDRAAGSAGRRSGC